MKNNVWVVVILLVLVLGLSGYIVYDKVVLDNEDVTSKAQVESEQTEEIGKTVTDSEGNNAVWVDYLLSKNITSASLGYYVTVDYSKSEMISKSIDLSNDEIKKLLNSLKSGNYTEEYDNIMLSSYLGSTGSDVYPSSEEKNQYSLKLVYESDNNKYIFYLDTYNHLGVEISDFERTSDGVTGSYELCNGKAGQCTNKNVSQIADGDLLKIIASTEHIVTISGDSSSLVDYVPYYYSGVLYNSDVVTELAATK